MEEHGGKLVETHIVKRVRGWGGTEQATEVLRRKPERHRLDFARSPDFGSYRLGLVCEVLNHLERFGRQTVVIVVHERPVSHPIPPVLQRAGKVRLNLCDQFRLVHRPRRVDLKQGLRGVEIPVRFLVALVAVGPDALEIARVGKLYDRGEKVLEGVSLLRAKFQPAGGLIPVSAKVIHA